jgi:hypothetical protein
VYSTAADLHRRWEAVHSGRIVSPDTVELMVTPRSDWPEESRRYGLGFHLHETGDAAWLEGYDAGGSFTSQSVCHLRDGVGFSRRRSWGR